MVTLNSPLSHKRPRVSLGVGAIHITSRRGNVKLKKHVFLASKEKDLKVTYGFGKNLEEALDNASALLNGEWSIVTDNAVYKAHIKELEVAVEVARSYNFEGNETVLKYIQDAEDDLNLFKKEMKKYESMQC